jgi:hypothetical protein
VVLLAARALRRLPLLAQSRSGVLSDVQTA